MVKQKTYKIYGFGLRGFHKYKEIWTPKKNEELQCSIKVLGKSGIVVALRGKRRKEVGSIPGGLMQESFRELLEAGGSIKAKVSDKNERRGPAGPEIPVTFFLTVPSQPSAKNALNRVKQAVKKEGKGNPSIKLEEVKPVKKKKNSKTDTAVGPQPSTSGVSTTTSAVSVESVQNKKENSKPDTVVEPQPSTSGISTTKSAFTVGSVENEGTRAGRVRVVINIS